MGEALENMIAVVVLSALSLVYLYLLLSPMEASTSQGRHFVIPSDTKLDFEKFMKGGVDTGDGTSGGSSSSLKDGDDFFLKSNELWDQYPSEPITPSSMYFCTNGWVSIRSEANYRYMWVYGDISRWLSAGATQNTPLNLRIFQIEPVGINCSASGWVRLKEFHTNQYLYLVVPNNTTQLNEWVVELGSNDLSGDETDERYYFLLEEAGYVLNKAGMAFLNVFYNEEGVVRGHSAASWSEKVPAGREYGALVSFDFVNKSTIDESVARSKRDEEIAQEQDAREIAQIDSLPTSSEKRVISFGLYGSSKKYTHGAVRNAELAKLYFPGWTCRFYVTSDVPPSVISDLKKLGSEIENIPDGQGVSAGMFYRFLVAADSSVDRYIIRDVDSRLNARDRLAVEEWITSKKSIHILRDHVNHCNTINGGMWGGVMGAIPHMREQLAEWTDKNMYRADMNFLDKIVWPDVMHRHIAHDSYCCDQFPSTRPFPTKRPPTYLHVGQVFDENDNPRMMDIEAFTRGVPIPANCRKDVSWIFG